MTNIIRFLMASAGDLPPNPVPEWVIWVILPILFILYMSLGCPKLWDSKPSQLRWGDTYSNPWFEWLFLKAKRESRRDILRGGMDPNDAAREFNDHQAGGHDVGAF